MADTGQLLLIKMKNEKWFQALLAAGIWARAADAGAGAMQATVAASAVSRTLCSTRSGLNCLFVPLSI